MVPAGRELEGEADPVDAAVPAPAWVPAGDWVGTSGVDTGRELGFLEPTRGVDDDDDTKVEVGVSVEVGVTVGVGVEVGVGVLEEHSVTVTACQLIWD